MVLELQLGKRKKNLMEKKVEKEKTIEQKENIYVMHCFTGIDKKEDETG